MRGLSVTVALAACLVAAGCGAKSADEAAIDAKGILVFSGMTSGSYLHAMRPDGTELSSFGLPKTCSPEGFIRRSDVLLCIDLGEDADPDHWQYAVERDGSGWRRISNPADLQFPGWASPFADNVSAPQWSPARDRIAFIRPSGNGSSWFSATGKVVVAEPDGSNERVVAPDGEAPKWSPDGKRLAFSRCDVLERNWEEFGRNTAECSIWTVSADGADGPELLVEKAASVPVWSPDGRFVAYLRQSRACEAFCRHRIAIVPSAGGEAHEVGPELVEPSDRTGWWFGLAWLPGEAPVEADPEHVDQLEVQRCVGIWNRARMYPWPTGVVNVSLVQGLCQVTVSDYGAICTQIVEMRFRFWCPSHGAGLNNLPPEYRVWNGHGEQDGTISLFDKPEGPRLPLPKAPPYALLDGYVIPYGKDGRPLPDLKVTDVAGPCDEWTVPDYPLAYPSSYRFRCRWNDSGSDECFKPLRRLAIGDTVLCPAAFWKKPYDPMRFFRVKVIEFQ